MHAVQVAEQEQSRAERLLPQLPQHWMADIFQIMLAMELHDVETALHSIQVCVRVICGTFMLLSAAN